MGRIIDYFNEYKEKYNIFKPMIRQIKRFEYTDGPKYSNLPCYFERGFIRKGKDVDKGSELYTYGFDVDDKLIYIKSGNYEESFLVYMDESINLYCYENDYEDKTKKALKFIQITELNNHRLSLGTIEVNKWLDIYVEKYYYENGKLTKIENPIGFEYGTCNDVLNIEYDDFGEVTQIMDKQSWLPCGIVYKRINQDSVDKLKETIINKVTENIKNEVINKYSNVNEKICYFSFEISEEPHIILSAITSNIALESERDKYVLENGVTDEKYIWNYSSNRLGLYDEQLKIECNMLVQHFMRYGDYYFESYEIIKSIIKKLREFKWANYTAISEDFEVLEPLVYD